jgi:hypothetical protein
VFLFQLLLLVQDHLLQLILVSSVVMDNVVETDGVVQQNVNQVGLVLNAMIIIPNVFQSLVPFIHYEDRLFTEIDLGSIAVQGY